MELSVRDSEAVLLCLCLGIIPSLVGLVFFECF